MDENFILQAAALVAAYVGVAKAFGLTERWTHPTALVVASVFVLVPDAIRAQLTTISVIGLTASGAYQYLKKRDDANATRP